MRPIDKLAGCLAIGLLAASAADGAELAILRFENATLPDSIRRSDIGRFMVNQANDNLGHAIIDMLTTDLFQTLDSDLLERSRVEAFLDEMALEKTGAIKADAVSQAEKAWGARYLLYGNITNSQGRFLLSTYLLDRESGNDAASKEFSWRRNDLFKMEEVLTKDIITQLTERTKIKRTRDRRGRFLPGESIAILPFNDNSGSKEYTHLQSALPDSIGSDLSSLPDVKLLERSRLDAILAELSLGYTGHMDEKTALKVGGMLGANDILFGSFTIAEDHIRIDVRLCQVSTGKTLEAMKATGRIAALDEVVDRLVDDLRSSLRRR